MAVSFDSWSRRRLLLLCGVALAPGVSGDFAWTSEPYYAVGATLPPTGTTTCCGSELVSDPAIDKVAYSCRCDVTSGVCDESCCCDPDCTYAQKIDVFGCTSNATASAPLTYTTCSDQLLASNLPTSARDAGWSVTNSLGGADGALCIVKDNSPARGAFFRDPVADGVGFTALQVSTSIAQAVPVSYKTFFEPAAAGVGAAGHYELGAPILGDGCLSADSSTGCSALTQVKLPARSMDGGCGGEQPVGFLRDVPEFGCALQPAGAAAIDSAALEALCATRLNSSFLRQAAFAGSPSDAAAGASLSVQVSTDGGATWAAEAAAAVSVYDAATTTCSDAMQLYQLKLAAGAQGTLDAVTAYVVLATITLASAPTTNVVYGAGFEQPAVALVRETSGRPGYIRGRPLLIMDYPNQLRSDGLRLLPDTNGACNPAGEGGLVAFGEAMARTCTMSMSASELEAWCTNVAPQDNPLIGALNLSWVASQAPAYVGVYGDSHPTSSVDTDWVKLQVDVGAGMSMSWDPTTQTCNNVLSGMHLEVLTADVGSTVEPITKVIGARLELKSRAVSARRCAFGAPCATRIAVTGTTTYASLAPNTYDFVPPTPTIIPPLSADFFYPFLMND